MPVPAGTKVIECAASLGSLLDVLSIPEGVEHIMKGAFTGASFSCLELPASVVEIDDDAFAHCTIERIVVHADNPRYSDGGGGAVLLDRTSGRLLLAGRQVSVLPVVESIDDKLCQGLPLKELVVPEGVKNSGKQAFAFCDELVCLGPVPPEWDFDLLQFNLCLERCTLFVPAASLALYRKADGWQFFMHMQPIEGV